MQDQDFDSVYSRHSRNQGYAFRRGPMKGQRGRMNTNKLEPDSNRKSGYAMDAPFVKPPPHKTNNPNVSQVKQSLMKTRQQQMMNHSPNLDMELNPPFEFDQKPHIHEQGYTKKTLVQQPLQQQQQFSALVNENKEAESLTQQIKHLEKDVQDLKKKIKVLEKEIENETHLFFGIVLPLSKKIYIVQDPRDKESKVCPLEQGTILTLSFPGQSVKNDQNEDIQWLSCYLIDSHTAKMVKVWAPIMNKTKNISYVGNFTFHTLPNQIKEEEDSEENKDELKENLNEFEPTDEVEPEEEQEDENVEENNESISQKKKQEDLQLLNQLKKK